MPPLFGTYVRCVPSITPCPPNRSLVCRGSVAQSVVRGVLYRLSVVSPPSPLSFRTVFRGVLPLATLVITICAAVRTKNILGGATRTYRGKRPGENDRSNVKGVAELLQEGTEGVSADKEPDEPPPLKKNRRQWRIRYASDRVSIVSRGALTLPSSLSLSLFRSLPLPSASGGSFNSVSLCLSVSLSLYIYIYTSTAFY